MRTACLAAVTATLLLGGSGLGLALEDPGMPWGVPVAAGSEDPATHERSVACSTQADQKGLHGKARKVFRRACMREKA